MRTPNPAYYPPYQPSSSMRMPNLKTKQSDEKLSFGPMPMYNSAVTPSSNTSSSPSISSVLKLYLPHSNSKQQTETPPSSLSR